MKVEIEFDELHKQADEVENLKRLAAEQKDTIEKLESKLSNEAKTIESWSEREEQLTMDFAKYEKFSSVLVAELEEVYGILESANKKNAYAVAMDARGQLYTWMKKRNLLPKKDK